MVNESDQKFHTIRHAVSYFRQKPYIVFGPALGGFLGMIWESYRAEDASFDVLKFVLVGLFMVIGMPIIFFLALCICKLSDHLSNK